MKKAALSVVSIFMIFALAVVGCGPQKAASSKDAIQHSNELATVDEKVNYLIHQANAFANSDEFNEAVAIAQHVLRNLDRNSTEAKGILEMARAELKKLAQEKTGEAQSILTSFGQEAAQTE